MGWQRVNRALHRDLGYLCVGFTLLFAVTGILLNHVHDWNPMYAIASSAANIGPMPPGADDETAREVLRRLSLPGPAVATFRPDPETLDLFLKGGDKLTVHLPTGSVRAEAVKRRTVLSRLNDLHLNRPRAPWTYLSDAYAAALSLLAVSGALLAGRRGSVSPRGVVLTLAGLALAGASVLFAL